MKTKNILLVLFSILSFYISDKVLIYVENLNPIMVSINAISEEKSVEAVNAIINDDTIIVGKNGKKVDNRESFLKMNEFGSYNENFLEYSYISPEISLKDNIDKYIIGSSKISNIAIITDNINVSNFLTSLNIKHSLIINSKIDNINNIIEYINGNNILNNYNKLERFLNKNKLNNNICIYDYNDIDICKIKKKYIIKPSYIINNNNYFSIINNINGGSIILINDNLSENIINNFIISLKKDNIEIINLSNLISE